MAVVFEKSRMLTDAPLRYCPGCTHGIAHELLAECIEERGLAEKAIGVAPVGCAVFAYDYFNCDMLQAAHGRAPAVATGVKRVHPENLVFTYQGDGDLASIGAGEIVSAAARGEKITTIFINNAIYGMTGGQMAPTTILGQVTATTPEGRTADLNGYPFKFTDMITHLDGVGYVTRQSVHSPGNVRKAKRAIRKAFERSMQNKGLSFIEFVSTCNSGWKMTPVGANQWMEENMFPVYPLGDLKEI